MVSEAMQQTPQPLKKTLKIETYENQIASHGRPDQRGNPVCPCRSSLRLFVRSAAAGARRGDDSRCAGCCDCACCRRAVSGGDNSGLSSPGLCLGAGLLVGMRLQPRVGSRLLALSFRAFRVCPSVWLASLMTEVVVAGLPRGDGQGSETNETTNEKGSNYENKMFACVYPVNGGRGNQCVGVRLCGLSKWNSGTSTADNCGSGTGGSGSGTDGSSASNGS